MQLHYQTLLDLSYNVSPWRLLLPKNIFTCLVILIVLWLMPIQQKYKLEFKGLVENVLVILSSQMLIIRRRCM